MAITHDINQKALRLIAKHPAGLRWAELQRQLKTFNPDWHPKTVNGCVWKLVENFPDQVYKPEKGLFRSVKFQTSISK